MLHYPKDGLSILLSHKKFKRWNNLYFHTIMLKSILCSGSDYGSSAKSVGIARIEQSCHLAILGVRIMHVAGYLHCSHHLSILKD